MKTPHSAFPAGLLASLLRLPRALKALLALAVGVVVVIAALDFQREGLRLEGRLRNAEQRLAEVRSLVAALAHSKAAGAATPSAAGGSALARADTALRTAGLGADLQRLEPQGVAVLVELGAHDWAAFATLLEELGGQGLAVVEARVESASEDTAGSASRVRARLQIAIREAAP
jgi:hypothetical protein